eukprot:CAMPEP_0117495552 /NCGR_PEP_ID=MMETSP0784-20121206/20192_1 /TAXON_ID=39447 /ORGANISM="" /LENGTH=87 /DNA_ID=CAMNT_0005290479 /DNA_START=57 /DNA_END=316 /DNA_ORIENTATION=-
MPRSSALLLAFAASMALASVVAFVAPTGDSSLRGRLQLEHEVGQALSLRPSATVGPDAEAQGAPPHDFGLRFGGFAASMLAALVVAL